MPTSTFKGNLLNRNIQFYVGVDKNGDHKPSYLEESTISSIYREKTLPVGLLVNREENVCTTRQEALDMKATNVICLPINCFLTSQIEREPGKTLNHNAMTVGKGNHKQSRCSRILDEIKGYFNFNGMDLLDLEQDQ